MRNFTIKIDKPCFENWSEMPPSEKSSFCKKCTTEVHDLTDKSPNQIRKIITDTGGVICSKTKNSLLNVKHRFKPRNQQALIVFTISLFFCFQFLFTSCRNEIKTTKSYAITKVIRDIKQEEYVMYKNIIEERIIEPKKTKDSFKG
jgi:hypothetical protein